VTASASIAARLPALRERMAVFPASPGWLLAALIIVAGVLAPLVSLGTLALQADNAHWPDLARSVLPVAASNTAVLLAGVGICVTAIGAGSAWLVTAFDFPFRRILQRALLLPLAMPTYIIAFVYLDMLHPIGVVQGAIRGLLGYGSPREFRLPDLRSMGGAIFVLSSVLYPYVYLTMRALFVTQPAHLMEAARALGESRWGAFRRVAWPMARPALAVGLSLAMLETLNDIGASEFLGIHTLTVSIYTTWVTRSDLAGAAQMACAMLVFVLAFVTLERFGRRHQRFGSASRMQAASPVALQGGTAWLATAAAALPVLVGFLAPAVFLLVESARRLRAGHDLSSGLIDSSVNTLGVALGVTVLAVGAGLVVAWAGRASVSGARGWAWLSRASSLGYAVPGTVLAIGFLGPGLAFDAAAAEFFGVPGLPLMAAGVVLVAACTIRFLAMPVGGIEAGLARIPLQLEQVSRTLGENALSTLRRVHLPLLRPAIAASALLVFVDAMKELPATLLLRPANFETLATWLYAAAARGNYEEGALAALAIVGCGVLPVILLGRTLAPAGQDRA
jgi:iron(III) transport system permease protein